MKGGGSDDRGVRAPCGAALSRGCREWRAGAGCGGKRSYAQLVSGPAPAWRASRNLASPRRCVARHQMATARSAAAKERATPVMHDGAAGRCGGGGLAAGPAFDHVLVRWLQVSACVCETGRDELRHGDSLVKSAPLTLSSSISAALLKASFLPLGRDGVIAGFPCQLFRLDFCKILLPCSINGQRLAQDFASRP